MTEVTTEEEEADMTTDLVSHGTVFCCDVKKEKRNLRAIIRFMLSGYHLYFIESAATFPSNFQKQLLVLDVCAGREQRLDTTHLSQFLFRILGRFEQDRPHFRSVMVYVRIAYFSSMRFKSGNVSPACFTIELSCAAPAASFVTPSADHEPRLHTHDDWMLVSAI
jgi:hypothetical protein